MKKLIVAVFAVFFPIIVSGQEIKVQEIAEIANDLEARTHPRQDLNGENCALLKIAAPSLENLVFSGNIVSDIQHNAGIYYVYVPKGTKRIEFQHSDYLPGTIDFSAFNISVEPSTVYSIILLKPDGQSAAFRQFIVFNVSPQSAVIELDGEMLPVSEGSAQRLVRFGTHHYRVSAPGLPVQEGDILVNSSSNKAVVNVSLIQSVGRIEVGRPDNTSIVGATVFLDDAVVEGTAPLTISNASVGAHTVRLVKPMYSSVSVDISVSENSTTLVNPMLESTSASVRVIAPDGCEITMNGQRVGSSVWENEISAGSYLFEAVLNGEVVASRVVDVTPSSYLQEIKIDVPGGILVIQSSTLGATVLLDGKMIGETPLLLQNVFPGSHSISLSKEGYRTETRTVSVESEKETELSVTLEKNVEVPAVPAVHPEEDMIAPKIKSQASNDKLHIMLEANVSVVYLTTYNAFAPAVGARVGVAKKLGGYLMLASNFGQSYMSNDSQVDITMYEVGAGLLFSTSSKLFFFCGPGYVQRNISMTSPSGDKYYDTTFEGYGAELGIVANLGKVGLSAGVFANTLFISPEIGVSVIF